MRRWAWIVLAAALCASLSACASLDEWLASPAAGSPVAAPGAPVELPTPPGSGDVVYTPPPAPAEPTKGEVLGQTIGQVAGVLSGNPAWGIVAGGALAALLGRRRVTPSSTPAE